MEDQDWLVARVHNLTNRRVVPPLRVLRDTSDFAGILGGDVLELDGRHFFILGDTTERRFGIEDQPRPWVKRAVELETGADKIIKLVFHENFTFRLLGIPIRCSRSPSKEARTLELLASHSSFMHGQAVRDAQRNLVRVIDFIRGPTLYAAMQELRMPHEQYYYELFPGVFRSTCVAVEALATMTALGLSHGDVRNDHIILERGTGHYRWIDLDLQTDFAPYDLWSTGNVLGCVVAKGFLVYRDLANNPSLARATQLLERGDVSIFYPNRIMNLGKVFPYLPGRLSKVLARFCVGAGTAGFYRSFAELIDDLRGVEAALPAGSDAALLRAIA